MTHVILHRQLRAYFVFCVVNFFLATTMADSVFATVKNIQKPMDVVNLLGTSLPGYATFFCSFIMLKALSGFPLQLLDLPRVIQTAFRRKYSALVSNDSDDVELPGHVYYGETYPVHLLIFVIGVSYSTIAPLAVVISLLYFLLGYCACKYQVLYVAQPVYESGGTFWPLVFDRMMVGLLICQLATLGLFGLKQVPVQTAFLFPLPFITYIFHSACKKAFGQVSKTLPLSVASSVSRGIAEEPQGPAADAKASVSSSYVNLSESSPLSPGPDYKSYHTILAGVPLPSQTLLNLPYPPQSELHQKYLSPGLDHPFVREWCE